MIRAAAWAVLAWAGILVALGEDAVIVRLGLYAAPWLAGLAAVAAAIAVHDRTWPAAGALAAAAVLLLAPQAAPLVRAEAPAPPPAEAVSVLSLSNRTRNADMAATAEVLGRIGADVMALQEVADPPALLAALAADGTGAAHACQAGTLMVVSRYPVGPPHPASAGRMLFCPVVLPGIDALVGSVHLPRAIAGHGRQEAALAELLAAIDGFDQPLILAGDFNATPLSAPIRTLGRLLGNAFDRAGQGFGFTFPTPARRIGALGPFVRIDHILVSGHFAVVAAGVLDQHPPGADHFPVRATIVPGGAKGR